MSLLDTLPDIAGTYREQADLSKSNWFRVGGPADVLFKPKDIADLQHFLQQKPDTVPVTVLGVGSNLLVRDGGIRGVVIKLGRGFAGLTHHGTQITAGAGALNANLCVYAMQQGIGKLSFLSGIPGTVGGAIAMNAGAYTQETKEVLVRATAVDKKGILHHVTAQECGFSYRKNSLPDDWIFVEAVFQGVEKDPKEIQARMEEIATSRAETQPIRTRTSGSTFTNPEGYKAWQLIDKAGLRGFRVGGAKISEMHCNFIENDQEASAKDIETLIFTVQEKVREHSGIQLHPEIKIVGDAG